MIELGEHKGDGIRYAMHLSAPKGGSAQMLRDPDGGWVSWEDYARLKAEVESLYRNGDLMLKFASANMPYPAYATLAKDWLAVKEGKQS